MTETIETATAKIEFSRFVMPAAEATATLLTGSAKAAFLAAASAFQNPDNLNGIHVATLVIEALLPTTPREGSAAMQTFLRAAGLACLAVNNLHNTAADFKARPRAYEDGILESEIADCLETSQRAVGALQALTAHPEAAVEAQGR